DRGGRNQKNDCKEDKDRREAPTPLYPWDRGDDEGGCQPANARRPTKSRCTGIRGKNLRREDLHRIAGNLNEEDHDEAGDQQLGVGRGIREYDGHQSRRDERAHRSDFAAEVVERVHHEEARAWHRQRHPEGIGKRFGDGEALLGHDVREPCANPMATPKNAEKQIMPAMTRTGNMRKTTAKGSLLVSLAAPVVSGPVGGANPRRARTSSASFPLQWVDR